jgi:hypothetical protein
MRLAYHCVIALVGFAVGLPAVHGAESQELSAKDAEVVWAIWSALGEAARSCKSEADARNYLETAGMVLSDHDREAAFAGVVEALAAERPACFLNAASGLRPHSLRTVVTQFLAKPRGRASKDIEQALSKHWNQTSFQPIRQLYLQSRK